MPPRLSLPTLLTLACILVAPASAQIAVTEFFNNPRTLADSDGEFVELFNFGTEPVNLNGWTISDEGTNNPDNDPISESDLFVPPGGYLVIAKNKAALEGAFFGGTPQANIVEVAGLTLGNSGDEIVISDGDTNIIWSLAYPDGEGNGSSAFLSEDDFSTTVWGSVSAPGIDFSDLDPASGTLGYQRNNTTTDPDATTVGDDTASPLAGFYTAGGSGPDEEFRILSIAPGEAPGSYDITFESELGATYSLETSTDLSGFTALAPATGTGPTTTVNVVPEATDAPVFYRVRKTTVIEM